MPFSVSEMIVDGAEKVVALKWVYANADGRMSNQHRLLQPYGNTPLNQVTKEVAVGWLVEQLQNTAEEFDAAIAKQKQQQEYKATLVPYQANSKAAPTRIISEPEPKPEPAPATATKRKAK